MKPNRLRKGSTIGLIAPANSAKFVSKNVWDIGVKKLETKGFRLVFGLNYKK